MCVLVTQSCLTLCDPMDCSPPGFSVLGIFQARILEWPCSPPGDLPDPGIEPDSPTLQVYSLPLETQFILYWRAWKTMMESRWVNLWWWKDRRETRLATGPLCCDQSHLHSDHPILHGQETNTGIAIFVPWSFKCNFILKVRSMDVTKQQ